MRYTKKQLEELIGTDFCRMYRQFNDYVLDHYNVSQIWDKGGRDWERKWYRSWQVRRESDLVLGWGKGLKR